MKNWLLIVTLVLGLSLTLVLLWLLIVPGTGMPVVRAATYTVCPDGPPTCDYSTVQAAVDAASDGDVIKVASGIYTGVQGRPAAAGYYGPDTVYQVVYINKTVIVRGGYTTTFTDPPDPKTNPTTLDAQGQGRVIYITGNISPTIVGLCITRGDAAELGGAWVTAPGDAGGGVYVVSATATIRDNWVFSNTANFGGGLYLRQSAATLSGNTVTSNTATEYDGGGLYLYQSAATLSQNTVISNTAYWGGGLRLIYSDATLSGNTVISNTANEYGGGLCLADSDASLNGNTISSNTAVAGAGLYLHQSAAMLVGNAIFSNTATQRGGGLELYKSNAMLIGNTISSNTAVQHSGGLYLSSSAATLSSNTISANTADYGGGLHLHNSNDTLSGNTVSANNAAAWGGGFYLYNSHATLDRTTISSNTADHGGGLYLEYSNDTLINSVVADNHANSFGSGLYVGRDSSPHLLHTTITRNSGGDGSGIYVTDSWGAPYSTVALTNTVLVSHSVGVYIAIDTTARLEGTLWGSGAWANETDWGGDGAIITGTVNLWGNPAFMDPNAGDYHIGAGSAALDAGVDAGVKTDLDNQPRPYQNPDLGADEYWPPGAFKYIYLPLVLKNQ